MRLRYFILLFLISFNSLQAQQISKTSSFSLLTVDPSDELYTSFGHSALRLRDSVQNLDVVFNWGVFNFNTPHFYLKFAGGRLNYMLATESFQSFITEMNDRQSRVLEQRLDLNDAEKQKLFILLQKNYLPENRFYKYDFFFDNCSTRIRDIVLQALDNHYVLPAVKEDKYTFRDLCDACVGDKPWVRLGMDLLLGLPSDKKADLYHAMYLPSKLYNGFEKLQKFDGTPLVKEDLVLLKNKEKVIQVKGNSPFLLMIIIVIAWCMLLPWSGRYSKALDGLVFTLTGILGWLLLAMWFLSDHAVMKNNLNVIWAFPFHLFFFIIILKKSWRKNYFIFTGSLTLLVLILFPVFPQNLNILLIPIILLLIIRSYSIAYGLDNKIVVYIRSLKK